MATIETVTGPVKADALGATLMHEHIFVRNPELESNYPNPHWDEEVMVARARAMMMELKGLGIDALVDVTVMGLGRDIRLIQRVAQGLDFHIVVSTGYYTSNELPAYFRTHGPGLRVDMPEPLYDMFVGDIRNGIAGSGVKAAVIKIATDEYGLTPDCERIFRAAARAQIDTGVPITTHTSAKKKGGLQQQAFLKKEGVDLTRVIIGHCGDTADLDYLRAVMDQGSIIGMDRFGLDNYLPAEDRVRTVAALCEQGYADRMIMSHDANVFSANTEPQFRAKLMPKWNYTYVPREIIPELKRRGVTDADIRQMMVENAKRVLPPQ